MKQMIAKVLLFFAVLVLAAVVLLPAIGRTTTPRIRAEMQARSVVQAMTLWAIEHDGAFPKSETWQSDLLNAGLLHQELLVSYGDHVERVYHYWQPSVAQYRSMLEDGRSDMIVVCEDPEVWRGRGGHVAYLDTRVEWVDGPAFAELVESLRLGDVDGGGG